MEATRVTLYRDPMGDRNWIVATDNGDASQEKVIGEYEEYDTAKAAAEKAAEKRGCEVIEEEVEFR